MPRPVLESITAAALLATAACGSSSPSTPLSSDTASADASSETGATSSSTDAATAPGDAAAAPDATQDAGTDGPTPPKDLGTTDGTVAAGWYCGNDPALVQHLATWNAPALENAGNLFHVGAGSDVVGIVGYCTLGCVTSSGGHDHCNAPDGTPIDGRECFAGAGKYCGHTLGIEARSYPVVPGADREGLFDCAGTTDVSLTSNCDCQVTPGGADSCVTGGGRKLWLAYETGTSTCVSQLTDFWDCLLNHSTYDALVRSYGTGYTLAWGGAVQIPASCGTDYQCAVTSGKLAVQPFDVVLIVTPGGVGGQNAWDPVVTVSGKSVHIHGGHIGDASGSCAMQTAYAMHEVYEATTDPGSADCCDGEIPSSPAGGSGCLAWNSGCSMACQKWGPSSCGGDGSYGLATLQCPHGQYTYQRVSPASDEYGFKSNQCLTITVH